MHEWASKPGGNGVIPLDHDDVHGLLGEIKAVWRISELLNWQLAASGEAVDIGDAAATKVFSTERIQRIGWLAEEIVGNYGNRVSRRPRNCWTGWTDRPSANLVITFGGGVNEVMREQVVASGLKGAEGPAVSIDDIRTAAAKVKAEGKCKPRTGRHLVNQPMIDHWLDAIGEKNANYIDEAAAKDAGHPGIVAPTAVIQVWTMMGLGGVRPDDDPLGKIIPLFDEAGYIGVVAATLCVNLG